MRSMTCSRKMQKTLSSRMCKKAENELTFAAANSHPPQSKACLDCEEVKPLTDFSPASRRSDGRTSYCKPCMRKRSKASYRRTRAAAGRDVREREELPDQLKRCKD